MDDEQRTAAAKQLTSAYLTRVPVAPLVESFPGMTMDDAYAIQALQAAAWLDDGRVLVGHKVGLTSTAMQQQMGVHEPDFGGLYDTMLCSGDAPISPSRFIAPRIEPEMGFVLRHDLGGPGVTVEDAAAAVSHVVPCMEIIDSRIADWRITIFDTIADNASSAGAILGEDRVEVDDIDLDSVGCQLSRDGEVVATGRGDAVLGTPFAALAWLANTLTGKTVLRAGQIVLSGSVTSAQSVKPGDTWTAVFDGVGQVTARFSSEVS